ncbi:hypothetical protein [Burkholderia gladioli]|uniref:hypothetical protein n=1 Tax=Burkholderia gladioli TaxID=28095 RepID=UPI00163E6C29|nr:hypothetical protein [Burkholderia gladioli]
MAISQGGRGHRRRDARIPRFDREAVRLQPLQQPRQRRVVGAHHQVEIVERPVRIRLAGDAADRPEDEARLRERRHQRVSRGTIASSALRHTSAYSWVRSVAPAPCGAGPTAPLYTISRSSSSTKRSPSSRARSQASGTKQPPSGKFCAIAMHQPPGASSACTPANPAVVV